MRFALHRSARSSWLMSAQSITKPGGRRCREKIWTGRGLKRRPRRLWKRSSGTEGKSPDGGYNKGSGGSERVSSTKLSDIWPDAGELPWIATRDLRCTYLLHRPLPNLRTVSRARRVRVSPGELIADCKFHIRWKIHTGEGDNHTLVVDLAPSPSSRGNEASRHHIGELAEVGQGDSLLSTRGEGIPLLDQPCYSKVSSGGVTRQAHQCMLAVAKKPHDIEQGRVAGDVISGPQRLPLSWPVATGNQRSARPGLHGDPTDKPHHHRSSSS